MKTYMHEKEILNFSFFHVRKFLENYCRRGDFDGTVLEKVFPIGLQKNEKSR